MAFCHRYCHFAIVRTEAITLKDLSEMAEQPPDLGGR